MAKKKEEVTEQSVLGEEAFTMRFNEQAGVYEVIKLSFDYDTKEARVDGPVFESRNEYKTVDALKLSLGKYLNKLRGAN